MGSSSRDHDTNSLRAYAESDARVFEVHLQAVDHARPNRDTGTRVELERRTRSVRRFSSPYVETNPPQLAQAAG